MTRRVWIVAGLPLLVGAAPPERTTVTVEIDALRSDRGMVQACLTADSATFPDCRRDPDARHLAMPAHSGETMVFDNVVAGRYAIALFHDENANGRMDKMLMMPREGFGFSRDAPVVFGPPHFSAAAFSVGSQPVRTAIKVRYLL